MVIVAFVLRTGGAGIQREFPARVVDLAARGGMQQDKVFAGQAGIVEQEFDVLLVGFGEVIVHPDFIGRRAGVSLGVSAAIGFLM